MNRILRRDGVAHSVLDLEPPVKLGWARLVQHGEKILERQDAELWARVSEPGFLPDIRMGVAILRQVATGPARCTVLGDDAAYRAFVSCCFLCTCAEELTSPVRTSLGQALLLLAECSSVALRVGAIPRWEDLPPPIRSRPAVVRLYPDLYACRCEGQPSGVLTLADALRVLEALELVSAPVELLMFRFELWYATEGLRTALTHLGENPP